MKTTQSKNTTNKKSKQRLAFPVYDEEDILNWDVAIITPPPRTSGTIRVRLIYKGRRKPMPVENPWEEEWTLDFVLTTFLNVVWD